MGTISFATLVINVARFKGLGLSFGFAGDPNILPPPPRSPSLCLLCSSGNLPTEARARNLPVSF